MGAEPWAISAAGRAGPVDTPAHSPLPSSDDERAAQLVVVSPQLAGSA